MEVTKKDIERADRFERQCKKHPELQELVNKINESILIIQDLQSNIKSLQYSLEKEPNVGEMNKVVDRVIKRYSYQLGEETGKINSIQREIRKTAKRLNVKW
ncbi:MAG: hypothetical protein J6D03_01470 [Clostridia bacterium]|nr:hypothetical protein [Clostridia bacterium]